MKKISDIYGIIKECRERIIKTMQERGIVIVQFCPTEEDYEHDHENDEEYQDYYDYRNGVCPNVIYFDKYCVGYEYTVLQVTLVDGNRGPYFKLECEASELGSDTFIDTDVYDMTWVYEMLEKHLGIEDEPKESFEITSVSREDLEAAGFDASDVDDDTMERLADKMGDAYVSNGFWIDLPIIAEYLEIPKKGETEEEEE